MTTPMQVSSFATGSDRHIMLDVPVREPAGTTVCVRVYPIAAAPGLGVQAILGARGRQYTGEAYTVTHLPSGWTLLQTVVIPSLGEAVCVARLFGSLGDWTRSAQVIAADRALCEEAHRLATWVQHAIAEGIDVRHVRAVAQVSHRGAR